MPSATVDWAELAAAVVENPKRLATLAQAHGVYVDSLLWELHGHLPREAWETVLRCWCGNILFEALTARR